MKTTKALLDFIRFPIAAKITFYNNVIAKLTGNPLFSQPDISLEEAKAATNALEAACLAAKDGNHMAVSAMHDAEEAADPIFRILIAYVNRIARGDETTLLSSGFHVLKQPATFQKPFLAVVNGDNSGSVKLVAKAVARAGAYIWQIAKDKLPETEEGWTTIGHSTGANFQVTNLDVPAKYYFRVAAITPDGTLDFTAAVMKVVV
jgi:hypothetical protein